MKIVFGGVIAIVLLGIYLHLVWVGYATVNRVATTDCNRYKVESFNDGMAQALAIVGGLVSALVIAELAATKPGEAPAARALSTDATERSKGLLKAVTGIYIAAWIAAGLKYFPIQR
jgi:ABC-type thiamin/hydroxymethylpyrimidine transport system permease subunit